MPSSQLLTDKMASREPLGGAKDEDSYPAYIRPLELSATPLPMSGGRMICVRDPDSLIGDYFIGVVLDDFDTYWRDFQQEHPSCKLVDSVKVRCLRSYLYALGKFMKAEQGMQPVQGHPGWFKAPADSNQAHGRRIAAKVTRILKERLHAFG